MHFSLMQASRVKWAYSRGEQETLTLPMVQFDHYKRIIILIMGVRLFGRVKSGQNAMYYSRVTEEIMDLDFIQEARKE